MIAQAWEWPARNGGGGYSAYTERWRWCDAKGRKLFWSRGNGWAMGGLARVLQGLDDDDPQHAYHEGLFRKMAAKLVALQKADGYWPAPLLDSDPGTPPESSGTAFSTYRSRRTHSGEAWRQTIATVGAIG